jgi:Tn3 transposase DDE domain
LALFCGLGVLCVFHGKRGELRQRYRQGQENQLSALGLVVNIIVLWNTIYMDAALRQLRKEGLEVRDEDVARLSPLGMLGRYAFSLPDRISRGELRPLRNPRGGIGGPYLVKLSHCYSNPLLGCR